MKRQTKDWKIVRHEMLTTISALAPNILNDRTFEFRSGKVPNIAVIFRYGLIAIVRDDLLVLGLKQSIPRDLAVKLIDALTKHCMKEKMNMAIVPLDEQGKPKDTEECLAIRV
jgi:hypothetical protein